MVPRLRLAGFRAASPTFHREKWTRRGGAPRSVRTQAEASRFVMAGLRPGHPRLELRQRRGCPGQSPGMTWREREYAVKGARAAPPTTPLTVWTQTKASGFVMAGLRPGHPRRGLRPRRGYPGQGPGMTSR